MTDQTEAAPEEPQAQAEVDEVERPVIITVSNRYKAGNGKETCITDRVDTVEAKKFKTQPAVVKRSYGITLKLGDGFEFARVDVGIELPCYVADIKRADAFADKFCEERLQEEIASIRGEIENDKKDNPL